MRNSKIIVLQFLFLTIISVQVSLGQSLPPKWIHNTPKASNNTYSFKVFRIQSENLLDAKKMLPDEASYYMERNYSVSGTTFETTDVVKSYANGTKNTVTIERLKDTVLVSANEVKMKLSIYDQYKEKDNVYFLCALPYPNTNTVVYDKVSFTTSYASDPATWGLALIPGAAQMHKGSYLKGGLIMGGSVALAAGALVAENIRNVNKGKIDQTHSTDVKKQYNDRVNTCATVRNICLGGLAAAYIYNILDAFVAPGARRVIVTPSSDGVGVAYKF